LAAGQIDAGVVSPPTNSRAHKAGFKELVNLAKEGPDYVSVAVGTSRSYLGANEDIVRRVVRSYAEGVYLFKTNKAAALKMIQNQLRVSDTDIQEDTHNQFRQYLEYPPFVNRKAMEAVLRELVDKESTAGAPKPEDFMDMRFVGRSRRRVSSSNLPPSSLWLKVQQNKKQVKRPNYSI
jgi:ABC-type nitrate/sulfonate/bicarbonate transport system substrate-binding protein